MHVPSVTHIVINVNDLKSVRNFYGKVFGFLGFKEVYSDSSTLAYANDSFSVWLNRKPSKRRSMRGIGYDHIALSAASRKQVDDLQKLLKKEKFRILYAAEEHPEFSPGYYSVSFCDPHGAVIELVYLPK